MATVIGSKRSHHQASTAPPRKINVQKFAEARSSELEALHSVVSNRLNNDFRSQRNKRRRTTAYNSQAAKRRHRKRPKLGGGGGGGGVDDKSEEKNKEKVPRHIRRRIELRKNPESGFSISGDGTKRLRTHVWHAKRFRMTKLWGFHLPLHLQGSGKGSRALLRRFRHGVVVHDASYLVPIQLEGSEDSLVSVLKMVLVPSSSAESEDISHLVRSGVIFGSAMLHHVGAPHSQSIAPVNYMWRPSDKTVENDGNGPDSIVCNGQARTENCSPCRQFWVWIHASAFSEGFDALKFACQMQMHEKGAIISCCLLEGQLANFQLIGSKAFQLLQKILQPVIGVPENSWQLKKCSVSDADDKSQAGGFSIPENEEHIPSHAILSYSVKDPRLIPKKNIVDVPELDLTNLPEAEAEGRAVVTKNSDENKELLLSSCSNPERSDTSGIKTLWDTSSRLCTPVEENVLCMEKHHQRMDFLCLDGSKSRMLKPSMKVQCSRSCSILLLKNSDPKGSCIGWSIILPLSWAKVFWIPLVSNGAHAIGLQDKHWIACEVGLPYFPSDFPDCSAYSSYMLAEAASLNEEAKRHPPPVRPFKIPILPPWDSVPAGFDRGPMGERDILISTEKDTVDGNSLLVTSSGNSAMPTLEHSNKFFKGIVARKSSELTNFLQEIHCEHLPMFPQVTNRKAGFLKFIKDESKFDHDQNGTSRIYYGHKLCFLRVLLHAFKEGAFEDGAVVCAPRLTDISLLTSSIKSGFQMPQSSVRSYWKEQPSGEWELQIPEEPALRESHRWPIGFITTGFVRGSKKPVAVAFCEAVLLAQLRAEQWSEMPGKRRRKEIYVLVRNLRSSAYRLSLATIVLERQEEDIGHM